MDPEIEHIPSESFWDEKYDLENKNETFDESRIAVRLSPRMFGSLA
jgi:hypothetical protein